MTDSRPDSGATAFARAWCDSFRAMLAAIDHIHPAMLTLSLPTRYGREDQGSAIRYLTGLLTEERVKQFQTRVVSAMNGPLPRCCDWRGGGSAGGQSQAFEVLGELIDHAYDEPVTAFDGKLGGAEMPAWLAELAAQVHRATVSLLDDVLGDLEAGTPVETILLQMAGRRDGTGELPLTRPMPPSQPRSEVLAAEMRHAEKRADAASAPYRVPVAVLPARSRPAA